MLLLLPAACTLRNDDRLDVRAPAKLRFALGLISDIGARASLVPRGGAALEAMPLVRGDDGVSFSGFIAAAPGEYTLELVFDGVAGGRTGRAFLGRLTSNAFTVTQGSAVTPVFSAPLDTIGRDGEGDGDADGFGLLDELLWGSDPERADSDSDTIADGRDCHPTDGA